MNSHSRCTLTIRNEPFTLLAILAAIEREFLRTDLPGGISYMPALLVQPIYRAQVGKNGEGKGNRNVLGLDGDEGEEDGEPLLRELQLFFIVYCLHPCVVSRV